MWVVVLGIGLNTSGPKMGFEEGPERRSGDLKPAEIGNRDFHSSDKYTAICCYYDLLADHERRAMAECSAKASSMV